MVRNFANNKRPASAGRSCYLTRFSMETRKDCSGKETLSSNSGRGPHEVRLMLAPGSNPSMLLQQPGQIGQLRRAATRRRGEPRQRTLRA